jgi:hypothetical protein
LVAGFFKVSGVPEGSGPSAGAGFSGLLVVSELSGDLPLSVVCGVSGDSGVLFGVFESPGGSGVGNGPASGDGSGAGSSKAGRAWCQGASVLRGAREALPGRLSPGWDAARWPTEPSDALRARRGSAGVVGGPGLVPGGSGSVADGSAELASDADSVADGSGPAADGWESVSVVVAGSDSVAWNAVPGVVDPESVDVWLAEPSAAERSRRGPVEAGAVGSSGTVWLAEPSAAVRARRGAAGEGVPASPEAARLAEPSSAERSRPGTAGDEVPVSPAAD